MSNDEIANNFKQYGAANPILTLYVTSNPTERKWTNKTKKKISIVSDEVEDSIALRMYYYIDSDVYDYIMSLQNEQTYSFLSNYILKSIDSNRGLIEVKVICHIWRIGDDIMGSVTRPIVIRYNQRDILSSNLNTEFGNVQKQLVETNDSTERYTLLQKQLELYKMIQYVEIGGNR